MSGKTKGSTKFGCRIKSFVTTFVQILKYREERAWMVHCNYNLKICVKNKFLRMKAEELAKKMGKLEFVITLMMVKSMR